MLPGKRLQLTLVIAGLFYLSNMLQHLYPYSSVQQPGVDLTLWGSDQPRLPRPVPAHEPLRLLHPPSGGLQDNPGLPGAFRRGGTPGRAVSLRCVEG